MKKKGETIITRGGFLRPTRGNMYVYPGQNQKLDWLVVVFAGHEVSGLSMPSGFRIQKNNVKTKKGTF